VNSPKPTSKVFGHCCIPGMTERKGEGEEEREEEERERKRERERGRGGTTQDPERDGRDPSQKSQKRGVPNNK
jgi:hypothetical protein